MDGGSSCGSFHNTDGADSGHNQTNSSGAVKPTTTANSISPALSDMVMYVTTRTHVTVASLTLLAVLTASGT